MARLEIRKLSGVRSHELNGQPLIIGRSSANPLQLRHSNVSRRHCVIEQQPDGIVLRDLQSHVGTTVNGQRITETILAPGDRVMVGPYELIVVDDAAPPKVDGTTARPAEVELQHARIELAAAVERLQLLEKSVATLEADRERAKCDASVQQRELDEARGQLQIALADRQAEQASHDQTREALRLARENHSSLESQVAGLAAQLEEARASSQAAAEQSQSTISSLQASVQQSCLELEQSASVRADLLARLRELERGQQHQKAQTAQSRRAWQSLRDQMQSLDRLAAGLSTVQNRLRMAESQWVEAEQVLSASSEHAPQAAVARQRQSHLSSQLDSLHRERDDAVGRLCTRMQDLLQQAGDLPTGDLEPEDRTLRHERLGLLSMFRGRKSAPSA